MGVGHRGWVGVIGCGGGVWWGFVGLSGVMRRFGNARHMCVLREREKERKKERKKDRKREREREREDGQRRTETDRDGQRRTETDGRTDGQTDRQTN